MSIQKDVLVIGSGAAGAVALARAKERGLNAKGVSKSIGASGCSSGAVSCFDIPAEATRLFQKLTISLGYVPVASAVTQVGLPKNCLMTQASQAFDLSAMKPGELLGVVEFSGLTCFRAAPVANMLKSHGYEAFPVTTHLGHWDTFLGFAKAFEDPDTLDTCMDAIVQAVETHSVKFKHIFLPAIFGLSSPLIFLKSLQMRAGVSFSELLGLSHSIPGLRLGQVLAHDFQPGTVIGFQNDRKTITQITLDSGEIIIPQSVILATGRYLSGGFDMRESVFGLPLVGQDPLDKTLACDDRQRPLGEFGDLFAKNLFVAGSGLGEGIGRAIATGYRAGDLC